MTTSQLCGKCKYLHISGGCDAFPFGIPIKILDGSISHIKPYFGDNGIQFKKNEKATEEEVEKA